MPDATVTLHDTEFAELQSICDMEQSEARELIIPYTLDRHRTAFADPAIVYKSIRRGEQVVGFVILALDPDGVSVELRRIVVTSRGRGIGTRAVELVHELCKHEFGRHRVWLDVFESNELARHVYERCGYSCFGAAEHEGRRLLLYETMT